MNIASFFARSYVDALSVALALFPANTRPVDARPANDMNTPAAKTASASRVAAGDNGLPRAA